jgi:photosystem II stability/assembly factor-like uncharacterized protein
LAVSSFAAGPGTFFAATARGLFRRDPERPRWIAVGGELDEIYVSAVTADSRDAPILYAATDAGVFRSADAGKSWAAVNKGLDNIFVGAIVVALSSSRATLYAGTDGGVFNSTDGGQTWTRAGEGLPAAPVTALATQPGADSVVYAGTREGFFKTTDGGAHWSPAQQGMPKTVVRSIAILHGTPGEIFAGTESGVFRSTDQGSSWTAVNSGLTGASVASLATDSSRLYASTASGLWTLSAGSWSLRSPDATGALLFANGVLYAAGSGTILRSSDGGKTWTVEPITLENPPPKYIWIPPPVKPRP